MATRVRDSNEDESLEALEQPKVTARRRIVSRLAEPTPRCDKRRTRRTSRFENPFTAPVGVLFARVLDRVPREDEGWRADAVDWMPPRTDIRSVSRW